MHDDIRVTQQVLENAYQLGIRGRQRPRDNRPPLPLARRDSFEEASARWIARVNYRPAQVTSSHPGERTHEKERIALRRPSREDSQDLHRH